MAEEDSSVAGQMEEPPAFVVQVPEMAASGPTGVVTPAVPVKRKANFFERNFGKEKSTGKQNTTSKGKLTGKKAENVSREEEQTSVKETTLNPKLNIFKGWKQEPKPAKSNKMTPKIQAYRRKQETIKQTLKKLERRKIGWKKDWKKYIRKSHRYIPPDFVIPEYRRKEVHEIDDLFGYRSELNESLKTLFDENSSEEPIDTISNVAEESQIELKESSSERDMSWLRDLSQSERSRRSTMLEYSDERLNIKNAFNIFWIFLVIGARMPFAFVGNPNRRIASECKFDTKRYSFYAFVGSTSFLLLVTTLSFMSFIAIFFEDEDILNPFLQTEKLLFDQQWVTGAVFLGSLVMASISSISVLVSGQEMANFITEWGQVLTELNFDATPGIGLLVTIFIVWSSVQAFLEILIFFASKQLNSFIAGTHFITILVFRHFDPEIVTSAYINDLAVIGMFLNIYAIYCSKSIILLVMVYSVGIANLAREWNFRLRMVLRQVTMKDSEPKLRAVFQTLNYEEMFEQHHTIVKLLKDMCTAFGAILISFYMTQGIMFASELIEVAVYLVGNKTNPFLDDISDDVIYKFEGDWYDELHNFFHLSQTIAIFLVVSLYLSSAGALLMNGLTPVIQHGLLNTVSTNQRKFILSLQMSFSAKQPCVVNVKGLFNVDRSFILAFFAGVLYFFSVMLQTNFPRLLNVPILFECQNQHGQVCIGAVSSRVENVAQVLEESFANIEKLRVTSASSIATMPTITLTAPTSATNTSTTAATTTLITMSTAATTTPTTMPTTATTTTAMTTSTTSASTTTTSPTTTTPTTTIPPIPFPCANNPGHNPAAQRYKCAGAEVQRYHVYDVDGNQKPIPAKTTWDCIYNPYPRDQAPYFDCFGNLLRNPDSCGMLGFGNAVGTPAALSIANVYVSHPDTTTAMTCFILDAVLYNQSALLGPEWTLCSLPKWFTGTVCAQGIHSPNAGEIEPTLETLRTRLAGFNPGIPATQSSCTELGPSRPIFEVIQGLADGQVRSIPMPVPSQLGRMYFPIFHPDIFGSDVESIFVYFCKNGAWETVSLKHDKCGGLDFNGITTPGPGPTSGFDCFTQDYCSIQICNGWKQWFDNDKPIF